VTAILLALLASAAWGTSDFIGGRATQGRHVIGVLGITRPAGLVLVGLVVLLSGSPAVGDRWPVAMCSAVILLGGMWCLYRALAIGPMSVLAPIFATGAIVPVLWGLVSGETPTAFTFVGLVLAGAGSVLAARAPSVEGERTDPRGVAYALGAAAGIGIALVLTDAAAEADAVSAVFVGRATEVVIIAALIAVRWRSWGPALRSPGLLPVAGWIDVSAGLLFALASRSGLLPVVSVLSSLYPVITVLLARALLAERMSSRQAGGAALTLFGVAVVAAAG
jgi:drug/metabolite transporter (DMT)-like permease